MMMMTSKLFIGFHKFSASCVPRPAIREIEKLLKSEMELQIALLHCIQIRPVRRSYRRRRRRVNRSCVGGGGVSKSCIIGGGGGVHRRDIGYWDFTLSILSGVLNHQHTSKFSKILACNYSPPEIQTEILLADRRIQRQLFVEILTITSRSAVFVSPKPGLPCSFSYKLCMNHF